ncbi:hypothetical protein [Pseudoalteromonas tunicata]|jgi:hypothetical protein|uniref:Uncharacterized protein n=1 Tax=Pseudoalteromonas tunicata D2 TaxID=87626 RepID=A4C8X9_9GAMM|nr:hypothetical protein [Pseudoalteromonas tunicata]ATC93546.1 hypothetical protein PTUN_a0822 [Pseudoalteromonas tunicata]AXT29389.1 hypothetical protein D1819_00165 [Pseudoalteromonas tunicata]EAR29044.1 hypothetical protein PTD2_08369 [Pseudoalteromonas tunicata D2]
MLISERLNTLELTIKSSQDVNDKPATVQTSETRQLEEDKVDISEEALAASANEKNDKPTLPAHIQAIVDQVKKLKQMLEEAKTILLNLSQNNQLTDEQKSVLLKQKQSEVLSLQGAVQIAVSALRDALKEAGISDPSLILDALS